MRIEVNDEAARLRQTVPPIKCEEPKLPESCDHDHPECLDCGECVICCLCKPGEG
jgi:hypothetical protein